MGAVLSQCSEDDKWHLVTYLLKSLNVVEWNYEIHDKEMLVIVQALEEWRHFLEGTQHKVEIWKDHWNLEYFMTTQKFNRQQARYSLYLSCFDFTLHHHPGQSMGKPDALSQCPDHGNGSQDNENIVLLKPELFTIRALEGLMVEGEEKESRHRHDDERPRRGGGEQAKGEGIKPHRSRLRDGNRAL
jgi:hypothetical protein